MRKRATSIRTRRTGPKRLADVAEVAFNKLIESILSGTLEEGSVLKEAELAVRWQISRTPIREAVRRAVEAGFVTLRPNRPPIIRPLTATDVVSLYDLREVLELHALKLAWNHIGAEDKTHLRKKADELSSQPINPDWTRNNLEFDLALHGAWMHRCGSTWLAEDLRRLYMYLRIFQRWVGHDSAVIKASLIEHLEILKALEENQYQAAEDALRRHIRNSSGMILVALAKSPQQPEPP